MLTCVVWPCRRRTLLLYTCHSLRPELFLAASLLTLTSLHSKVRQQCNVASFSEEILIALSTLSPIQDRHSQHRQVLQDLLLTLSRPLRALSTDTSKSGEGLSSARPCCPDLCWMGTDLLTILVHIHEDLARGVSAPRQQPSFHSQPT